MRIKLNKDKKRRNAEGFTLAEVVVAVGVLAISFVSLYAGMSAGFAMTRVSRENLRATHHCVAGDFGKSDVEADARSDLAEFGVRD